MSKFDDQIALFQKTFTEKLNRTDINAELLSAIARSLGPSIYNKDSAKVACSKKDERDRIKRNFLIKKLELKNDPTLDQAILDVCDAMGKTNRSKYRVVFYYLLVEKFNKQSLFIKNAAATKSAPKAAETTKKETATLKTKSKASTKAKANSSKIKEETSKSKEAPKAETTTKEKAKTTFKSIGASEDIINKYALRAALAGLVPVPLIDLAAITAVQFKMIKSLAKNYPHVNFDSKKTKSVLAALMGGVTSFELGLIARLLFKGIPFFGPIIGGTAMSGIAYSSTKLIGDIFDEHFATGKDLSMDSISLQKMMDAFKWELGRD